MNETLAVANFRARSFSVLIVVACASALMLGCEGDPYRKTEIGAAGGGALGAGLGAIIGHQTGHAGAGVAIGAAAGALSGALVGHSLDDADHRAGEQDDRIRGQERELAENRRLIDELRSRGVEARSSDRGVVVNLPDVLFDFNSARLTPDAIRTSHEISSVLKKTPGRHLSVEGHTDSIGTIAYNQHLSEERAHSVARELVAQGVSRARMSTRGMGESDPIASNKTDSGRRRNRRVEVVIENR